MNNETQEAWNRVEQLEAENAKLRAALEEIYRTVADCSDPACSRSGCANDARLISRRALGIEEKRGT